MSTDWDGSKREERRNSSRDKERSQSRTSGESRSPVRIRGRRCRSGSRSPLADRKTGRGRSDSDFGGSWKGNEDPAPPHDPSRRPRGGNTCRDFLKGNCRYGDTCRFSHPSQDDGYNSNKTRSGLCKYFLAGTCQKDNCRFSHGTTQLQDRLPDQPVGTLKPWNGPLWDEPPKPVKILKWGETVPVEVDLSQNVSASRRSYENRGDVSASRRGDENRGDVSASRRGDENRGDVAARKGHEKWGDVSDRKGDAEQDNVSGSRRGDEKRVGEKWGDEKRGGDVSASRKGGDVSANRKGDEKWGGEKWGDEKRGDVSANRKGDEEWGGEKWGDVSASRKGDETWGNVSTSRKGDETWGGDVSASRKGDETWGDGDEKRGDVSASRRGDEKRGDVSASRKGDEKWGDVSASRKGDETWGDVSASRKGDEKRGCSLEDEIKAWEQDKGLKRNNYDSNNNNNNNRANDEINRHMVAAMATQQNLILNELSSHAHIPPNHNIGREAGQPYSTAPSANPQVPAYHYQGMPEHNRGPVVASGVLYGQNNWQHSTDLIAHSSFPVQAPIQHNTLPTMPVPNAQNIAAVHAAKSFLEEYKTQLHAVLEPSTAPCHNLLDPVPQNVYNSTSGYSKVEGNETNSKVPVDNNFSNRGDYQGKDMIMLFKNALVEVVKDILRPIWKEGNMSREVYKTVVKKVVDKVSATVQAEHVPSQEKVDEYLSSNRPNISDLVKAYVELYLKG